MTNAISPFRIAVGDNVLEDLRTRLRRTRWPEAELVDDWSQGAPLNWIKDICQYWAETYDWRQREARLNRFSQFTTEIDGLNIHFIHVRSKHPEARPLMITHGWPGSVVEFHKVIEPLTDPTAHGGSAADAFHVVCPSLPGFGFSAKPAATGWGVDRIAKAWAALMERLATPNTSRKAATGAPRSPPRSAGRIRRIAPASTSRWRCRPGPMSRGSRRRRRPARSTVSNIMPTGIRLLQAAVHPAADARLCADGFAERAGGLDPGKVLGLDRLRRASGKHPQP